ncbi:MAG: DNA polymerase III subunit chi [Rhodospirillaceae bacterium]|nr:MAG: DNA polymerase III subunit chi [Rhodospirillaceae bacterium]
MRVDFYHLLTSPLERALPLILEKVLQAGQRAVVLAGSETRVEALADVLWTYNSDSWLPHGTRKDGSAADQPIWLTDHEENPNAARVLVLTDGMTAGRLGDYDRCLDMFDGADETATAAARNRWSEAKAAGHELHYWQQTESGWQEKAS